MANPLTVHNAEITTATVEIRTLTISGKQVTLAVFRQLLEVPLVADDGTLNGLPWGVVNYHPGKCADDWDHVHVVWQSGTELRRSRVKKPQAERVAWPDAGEDWLDAAILDGWRLDLDDHRPRDAILAKFANGVASIPTDRPGVRNALWPRFASSYGADSALEVIRERSGSLERSTLSAEVDEELAEVKALIDRRETRWTEIGQLPQLFIAV